MKHKYAEILSAIAEGRDVKIEGLLLQSNGYTKEFSVDSFLELCNNIHWTFRIKPDPKPDVVKYRWARVEGGQYIRSGGDNLKLTFSGETGALISSEVL